MPSRYYSAIAQDTTLTSPMTAGDSTMTVGATVGFPTQYPFVMAVDYNAASEELVLVNGVSGGTTLNITRAYNGTTATSHKTGAIVRHVIVAQDMTDMQAHFDATANVHGVTGPLAAASDITSIAFLTMGA